MEPKRFHLSSQRLQPISRPLVKRRLSQTSAANNNSSVLRSHAEFAETEQKLREQLVTAAEDAANLNTKLVDTEEGERRVIKARKRAEDSR